MREAGAQGVVVEGDGSPSQPLGEEVPATTAGWLAYSSQLMRPGTATPVEAPRRLLVRVESEDRLKRSY